MRCDSVFIEFNKYPKFNLILIIKNNDEMFSTSYRNRSLKLSGQVVHEINQNSKFLIQQLKKPLKSLILTVMNC